MQRLIQLTLDLFDLHPAAPAAAAPAQSPVTEPNRPPALANPAPPAIEKIANSHAPSRPLGPTDGAGSLRQAVAPVHFRHPRANREVLLGGSVVAYEFRRAKRRTIGFVVGPDGLVVSAPKWVTLHDVDGALREKSTWIVRKLTESQERHQRMESARIEWKDGTVVPFLGESVIVVLDPRHGFSDVGAVLNTDAQALPGVPRLTLHVGLPHTASPQQIRDAVQAWLMRQAKRLFTERLEHFAPLLGVQWRKMSLSSAGTRWGSASADGSIRLNWRLVHFKMSVIDYVVAHELSHLRVMDHSPRFWDTVASVMPDYPQLRRQLKDDTLPRWE
jgi:predicted metal-dependent hydrolase